MAYLLCTCISVLFTALDFLVCYHVIQCYCLHFSEITSSIQFNILLKCSGSWDFMGFKNEHTKAVICWGQMRLDLSYEQATVVLGKK